MYINDLPLRINSLSEPLLFADDTSVIISNKNFNDFSLVSNLLHSHMIIQFAANNLVLNLDKMNIVIFITKNSSHSTLHIDCKETYVSYDGVKLCNYMFRPILWPSSGYYIALRVYTVCRRLVDDENSLILKLDLA